MSAVTQKVGLTYFLSKFCLSLIQMPELLQSRMVTISCLCDVGKVVKMTILLGYPHQKCHKLTQRQRYVVDIYIYIFFFFSWARPVLYEVVFLCFFFVGLLFREHPKAQPEGGFRRSQKSNLRPLLCTSPFEVRFE